MKIQDGCQVATLKIYFKLFSGNKSPVDSKLHWNYQVDILQFKLQPWRKNGPTQGSLVWYTGEQYRAILALMSGSVARKGKVPWLTLSVLQLSALCRGAGSPSCPLLPLLLFLRCHLPHFISRHKTLHFVEVHENLIKIKKKLSIFKDVF